VYIISVNTIKLPLRQRKLAQTRLGLLRAAVAAIDSAPLEAVSVRSLCEAVGISEAGFFNYFPKKSDLLVYFIQIWSLEMAWHAEKLARDKGGLAAIGEIFKLTARQVGEHPGVMAEIIAHQARSSGAPVIRELTTAEKLLAFPGLDGIENVRGAGLDALIPPLLEQAVARRELPKTLDRPQALLAIATVFFGVPTTQRRLDGVALEALYLRQLQIVWSGLRAPPERKP